MSLKMGIETVKLGKTSQILLLQELRFMHLTQFNGNINWKRNLSKFWKYCFYFVKNCLKTQLVTFFSQTVLIHFPPIHSCQHFCCSLGHWVMTQPNPPVFWLQPGQVTSSSQGSHRARFHSPQVRAGSFFAHFCWVLTNANRYKRLLFQHLLGRGSKGAEQRPRCDIGREQGTDWVRVWRNMRASPFWKG